MFIKWRTYQRQKHNRKGDKFRLQPILVESVRLSKKLFKEYAESQGMSDQEFKEHWEEIGKQVNRSPRHSQVYRFPSFPSCAYVHYDEPQWIEQRKYYWEWLELLLEHNYRLSSLSAKTKQKIVDEIESILPKPYGELLKILERAYESGMPKDPSPKESFERRKM